MMSLSDEAIAALEQWYADLDLYQDRLPSKGAIAAALVVLARLRVHFDLDVAAHVAEGGAQITGQSAASVQRVLGEFGETRVLSAVGGRSNRGARGDVQSLLDRLRPLRLDEMPAEQRDAVIREIQAHVVREYVSRYFKVKRVKASYDPAAASSRFVHALLVNARASGKAGAVAEYLVGAKLALRFPDKAVRNKRFSVADAQGGFAGDFELGSTAFHVTVAPMPELFAKCRGNLDRGLRVYLLVPESQIAGARQNAELLASGRIAVEGIESFVATNVDELSEFDGQKLVSGFRRLLELYNARVDAVEIDKSLLIEIPANLV